MRRRYVGPNAEAVVRRLHGSSQRPDHAGRWRLRGYCHGHGDNANSASLVVQDRQDGGLSVHCFAGCERRDIITALEQATGLTIWNAWDSTREPWHRVSIPQDSKPERPEEGQNHGYMRSVDMLAIARSTWRRPKSFLQTLTTPPDDGLTPGTSGAPVFPCPAL